MTEPMSALDTDEPQPPAPVDLDAALARLQAALTSLELAAARRREADLTRVDLDEAFAAMQDDRSRLAIDLDESVARARRLEAANEEVARRLDGAGAALRALADEPAPDVDGGEG